MALLARIAEHPGGARAVAVSLELVTRLVDILGESEDGRMAVVAKVAVLGDGRVAVVSSLWPGSMLGIDTAGGGGHRSSRRKKKVGGLKERRRSPREWKE
jgi:hypothetical protein